MTRAVVFAYHNVGVRCLRVLLAHGVDVRLVVTHVDDPRENRWFASVADVALECGIPTCTPDDPNAADVVAQVRALDPDFLFSFYYRMLLAAPILAVPKRGALNMHGSLLPRYRGRAPVNWAVLHGERETGATLHYMTERADAGDIVAQSAVPILPDDTAKEVFDKVTVAAEVALDGVLTALISGTAPRRTQDLSAGRYFGGRRPQDGIIDWSRDATAIHNLVRAVAPPYPGARTTVDGVPALVLRTRVLNAASPPAGPPAIEARDGRIFARCGGGGTLSVLALQIAGQPCTAQAFRTRFGNEPIALPAPEGSGRRHV
jgi:methionyl-tRNA formyltransferase